MLNRDRAQSRVINKEMSETIKNGGSLKRKMLVIDLEFLSKKLGENARKLSLKYDWHNLSKQVLKIYINILYLGVCKTNRLSR